MRWYMSSSAKGVLKIEPERWTGKPEQLEWYTDEGDTQWHKVTEDIRKESTRKKTRKAESEGELFTSKRRKRNEQ